MSPDVQPRRHGGRRRLRWVAAVAVLLGIVGSGCAAPARDVTALPPQTSVTAATDVIESVPAPPVRVPPPAELGTEETPAAGSAFATVTIPRFGDGWSVPIREGVDPAELDQFGLGHFPDSALPGEVGNFALAGHRTLHGAALYDIDLLRDGDEIVVTTDAGRYTYAVSNSEIVTPDTLRVVSPDPQNPGAEPTDAVLTLVACHPKGSLAYRWIAYATLVSAEPLGSHSPSALPAA